MRRWLMVLVIPVLVLACGEAGNDDGEQVEQGVKDIQTKEERQEEIASMEKDVAGLVRSERTKLLDAKADRLLKRYRDYVSLNPRDSITAEYLFKAADLSIGVGQYDAAINYLDRLNTDFPTFRKNVEMWLFKGFIYETYLNDYANAAKTYQTIVDRYPNHRLANDARASIENLTMSEEELLEKFERMNAETAEESE